jgi:outer membrane protein TolC
MFPWFGTNATKVNTYEFNAQAKYQEFVNKKNELYFKIKAAYYPIYEINEHIKWQKENLEILESYKRLSTSNFSNGKSAMVDVIRVDIMIDNAVTELKLLEDKIRPLEITFNRLLNRADSMSVVVPQDLKSDLIQVTYDKDSLVLNNPLLKGVALDMQSVAAMEETAKKQGLPSFGVGIDYVIVDERNDIDVPDNGKNAFMPMVTMSLPLFRNKYKASIKEAQFMHSALAEKKLDLENQLVSSFESERYGMERARQMIDLYDQQILKTKQAINLLYSSYANSGKEFEEVLRMEQQLLKYKIAKASALKDYYISAAKLNYITAKSE